MIELWALVGLAAVLLAWDAARRVIAVRREAVEVERAKLATKDRLDTLEQAFKNMGEQTRDEMTKLNGKISAMSVSSPGMMRGARRA